MTSYIVNPWIVCLWFLVPQAFWRGADVVTNPYDCRLKQRDSLPQWVVLGLCPSGVQGPRGRAPGQEFRGKLNANVTQYTSQFLPEF